MDFKETFRHEVYLSRRDRSRRALFMAKITSIVLIVTIGAALRSAPELRRALMTAGMDGVSSFANLQSPAVAVSGLPPVGISGAQFDPQDSPSVGSLPASRIKVNRIGQTGQTGQNFQTGLHDTNGAAQALGLRLQQMQPGG